MTLDGTFQTHLLPRPEQSAPNQHDKENMDGRPDQEEMDSDGASDQQIPAEVGEAREEGLQGSGSPTVTLAQDCTRVKGPLAPRLWPRL